MKQKITYYLEDSEREFVVLQLKQRHLSIEMLAKLLVIGKSHLYNILRGVRAISQDKYAEMLQVIQCYKYVPSEDITPRNVHLKPNIRS